MRTACTYIDMLFSNEYYFLIYVPTRVTENTAIIINYTRIITNDHTHQIIGDKSRFNRPLPYFL